MRKFGPFATDKPIMSQTGDDRALQPIQVPVLTCVIADRKHLDHFSAIPDLIVSGSIVQLCLLHVPSGMLWKR
jgi:hypothetical protein